MSPLASPEIVVQWYKIENDLKEPLELSAPFISVVPGTYAGMVSCFKDGTRTTAMTHPINVISSDAFFEGIAFRIYLCINYYSI